MKRILIVDDEPTILASLPRALQVMCDFKGEISTAESGREAIFKTRQCPYDLCFIDVKLPDISGFIVMKSIREIYPDANIVLMSASHVWSHMNKIIGDRDAFFIGKPFNFLQIRDILKNALGGER